MPWVGLQFVIVVISEQTHSFFIRNTAYSIYKNQSRKSQKWNLCSSLCLSEANLILFVKLNHEKLSFCNKKCMEFTADQTLDSITTLA